MQPDQWELLVLKPSSAFLTYLTAHLPHIPLPELNALQTDNTGYLLPLQGSEEELLDEIERHYPVMFKYEMERWLGDAIYQDAKASFLDFLCCFKFDMHSQILLMEDTFLDARHMISVKPRAVLLKWIRAKLAEYPETVMDTSKVLNAMMQWAEYGTVIMKNLDEVHALKPFLKLHYDSIYSAEIQRFDQEFVDWPEIDSYQMFCRYFTVELHTKLVHLSPNITLPVIPSATRDLLS